VKKRLMGVFFGVLAAVAMVAWAPAAIAAPNQAPDPNYLVPYPNEVWLLVANANSADANYIDAAVSQVKLYSNSPNFSVRIDNPNVCRHGGSLDQPFVSSGSPVTAVTNYRVYPLGADERTPIRTSPLATHVGRTVEQNDTQSCGFSHTMNFTMPESSRSTIPGHENMYVAYFEGVFGGTTRGYNNRFKLTMSDANGIIAYSDGAGVSEAYKFALLPDRRPVEMNGRSTYHSTYRLPFGPSCDVTSPQNVQLRWFDDDYNEFNQNRPIGLELRKFNATTRAHVSTQHLGTPTAGPNQQGSRTVLIEPGFVYEWAWVNVQYNNGLQFQLPYDSIYFYRPCPTASDYNMNPQIGVSINDGTTPGTTAEAGDKVVFTYEATNGGTTTSANINCNIYGTNHTGYRDTPTTPTASSGGGYAPPGMSGCPGTFNANQRKVLATETINAVPGNSTVCRSLFVQPQSDDNPSALGREVCVVVANKPYVKVYGGDVMAGSGLATAAQPGSCTPKDHAGVLGWNRRDTAGYAAAGTRYATYALSAISDFATAQQGAGAGAPKGLSFGNQDTNIALGGFGGEFGNVPCIPDYFARKPASASTMVGAVTAMTTGTYANNAKENASLVGGIVNAGERISVYIDGDLHLDGNITYENSWSLQDMPLFQVVVRGNIFVGSNVTRLDGIYIAQKQSATEGGAIYTCADSNPTVRFQVIDRTGPNFYSTCNSKLTVNGAFVANQIALMRTTGTQRNATAGEASTSGNIAEVFNYGPAFWMAQPDSGGAGAEYDSITSLPPIL
jgi:hypothetical protein